MTNGNLDRFDYYFLLERALSRVPDTVDKRQGSVIFDAIAPCCYELAEAYIELIRLCDESFADTASGEFLDRRCAEAGVFRRGATKALCLGRFTLEGGEGAVLAEGTRFSLDGASPAATYAVKSAFGPEGEYLLECEQEGAGGNNPSGKLSQLDFVPGLVTAELLSVKTQAVDAETDDELRARYMDIVTGRPFGGNISQYRAWLLERPEVGAVQVYPVWNGGGTVKCSVISKSFEPLTAEELAAVQDAIDPPLFPGKGRGAAPIGHSVTIATPQKKAVNITCGVGLKDGITVSQVTPLIKAAVENYLLEVKKAWDDGDGKYSSGIYTARVNAAILSVPGVQNVSGTTLGGAQGDMELRQDEFLQELPAMGGLIISEI